MSKINHQHAKNLIQASMGSSISQPEEQILAYHLDSCASCRTYARQIESLEGSLRRSFHARWDSTRGPSPRVTETILKKGMANLKAKRVIAFANTAIVIALLVAFTIFALSIFPGQNGLLPVGLLAQTNTPPIATPIVQGVLAKTVTPNEPTAIAAGETCTSRSQVVEYTVQEGDSLAKLADQYCLKPETIYWANHNQLTANDNTLLPGMVIDIPAVDGVASWVPPSYGLDDPDTIARLGAGACQDAVNPVSGTGTFLWPTTLHFISGEDYSPDLYQFGIDLSGSVGDPVYASDHGVVVFAGWSNWGYGSLVVIDHGSGVQTLYAYLSNVAVSCGEVIEEGSLIGKIGLSGKTIGPALHFEIIIDNTQVNPHDYLPAP